MGLLPHHLPVQHAESCGPYRCKWEIDPAEFSHIPLPEPEQDEGDFVVEYELEIEHDGVLESEQEHRQHEKAEAQAAFDSEWDVDPDDDYEEDPLWHSWYEEGVDVWRSLSRQFRVAVRLSRQLHSGQLGRQKDWDALPFLGKVLCDGVSPPFSMSTYERAVRVPSRRELQAFAEEHGLPGLPEFEPEDDPASADAESSDSSELIEDEDEPRRYDVLLAAVGQSRMEASIAMQRQVLSEVINYWLRAAAVRPSMTWSGDKPSVELGGEGLFGALAVQLLFDSSRTDGLTVCTSCGTPFLPAFRRPRRDRNPYCSDCGMKAAARDAAARYRQTAKYRATYDKWVQERRGS